MPSITHTATTITFSNTHATFKIRKADAVSESYIVKQGNKDLLEFPGAMTDFALYGVKDAPSIPIKPKSAEYQKKNNTEGILKISFDSGLRLDISCKAEETCFLFELTTIDTSNAQNLTLEELAFVVICQLYPRGEKYGGLIGAVHNCDFVLSQMALNKTTHINSLEQSRPGLYAIWAQGFSAVALSGLKVALLGCAKNKWLLAVETLAQKFDLPRPLLNGLKSKSHPDVKTSYLFIDLTKNNAPAIIQYAKQGRFKYVMPYAWVWAKSYGGYKVNTDHFPAGLEDLKSVAEMLREKGLKLGLHNLSFLVSKTAFTKKNQEWEQEPLVADPHLGLAKESPLVLKSVVQGGQDSNGNIVYTLTLSTASIASHLEDYPTYFAANQKDILIGKEIFTAGVFVPADPSLGTPAKFENCLRGRYHTQTSSHDADATVWHLPEIFGAFLADTDSNLPDLVAENFAKAYNHIKGGLVFLDCSECQKRIIRQDPNTYHWDGGMSYSGALVAERYLAKFEKGALLQGSSLTKNNNFLWHQYTRGTGGDYGTIGVEGIMDHQRIGHFYDRVFAHSFFPMELGWIALLSKPPLAKDQEAPPHYASYPSTTADEIEYQMNRALGFGLPISLETEVEQLKANGATKEILDLIAMYESVRQVDYFPANMLERLQRPDIGFIEKYGLSKMQYRLVRKGPLQYGLVRQAYLEKVLLPGASWPFHNPFHGQPLQIKITPLPQSAHFDHPDNEALLVADNFVFASDDSKVLLQKQGDGTILAKYWTTTPNAPDHSFGWMDMTLNKDLSRHKALELALEVVGDGKRAQLDIHLIDESGSQRQFHVELDFTGSQNLRLFLPSGNDFFKHQPAYGGILALRQFNWSKIRGLTIYVKRIPLDESGVRFKLHGIRALMQEYPAINTPAVTVGNKTATFLTALNPRNEALNAEPWEYLVFDGIRCVKCDGNNNKLDTATIPPAQRPLVATGENTLLYAHQGSNPVLARVLLEDKPIFPIG